MIGGGNNFTPNGAYIIQQQETKSYGGSNSNNLEFMPGKMRELAQAVVSGLSGTNEAAVPPSKPDEIISSSQGQPPQENTNAVETQSNADVNADNVEIVDPPVSFVNSSNAEGYMSNGEDRDYEDRLRLLMKCNDKEYVPETLQRGDFWVLKNYVRAEHGELKCHESITYTTHADFTFLDNLIPLLERWVFLAFVYYYY